MGRFPVLLLVTASVSVLPGCRRSAADSSDTGFATPEARANWVADRISGAAPSAIRDAEFRESESRTSLTSSRRGYTGFRFQARITIDSADAPAWAARVKPTSPPVVSGDSSLLGLGGTTYSGTGAELEGAKWYDPAGLFAKNSHRHYRGGHMAITADGSTIVVWQRWR